MKPRTVLVLAVVVAVLAAFIWFVERDLPSSDERAELAGKLLVVEPGDVTALTTEWQGHPARLERRGEGAGAATGGWWLVEPMSARADSSEVDRLLDTLAGLEKKRTLEEVDLQAVGLDAPRGTVTLRAGDREWTLTVGADVPASEDVLVSLAEGGGPAGTYVTTGSFVDQIEREPGAWRDREVFPAVQGAVERVTLRAPGLELPTVLERRGDRFWLTEPVADLADADRVDELLAGLTGLRVTRFIDDVSPDGIGGADLGLASPRLTIEASLGEEGGEPFRLELGAPDGDGTATAVYARSGGQTFTASTDLVALGAVPAGRWRSPAWTGLRSYEIDGVEVEAPDGSFILERDGVDWQRDGETLPYGVVSDLLSAVTGARGEVAEGGEAPSEAAITLRITRGEGDPVTLTLAADPGTDRLARSSERTVAVRLSAETAESIEAALAAVRDAEPEPVAPAASADASEEPTGAPASE